MAFRKGQSGNPQGRPKGATNKAGREACDILRDVIEQELASLPERLCGTLPG